MRCGFCHSGKVKSAEQYGVNRQQCGSCNTITKQAELKLTETQQKMINYLSNWNSEFVINSRDITQDLDQDGVARAIGISRSNIVRVVSPLLDSNLVGQKKAHILDENNRTIGKMKKWVYYLTPAGKALVTESFNSAHGAETFEATRGEMRQRRRTPFYELPYEEESEDKDVNKFARTNAGGALWQATYYALLDEGRSHEQAETFCNTKFFDHYYEAIIEGLREPMRNLFDNLRKPHLGLTRKQRRENRIANKMFERYFPDMASEKYESHEGGHFMAEEPFICPECRRASTKSKTSQVCVRCESEYQAGRNAPMRVPWPGDEGYYAETFAAEIEDCGWCGDKIVRGGRREGKKVCSPCVVAYDEENNRGSPCVVCDEKTEMGAHSFGKGEWVSICSKDCELEYDDYEAETFKAPSHCASCGWNLVQVPIGTETKWGVAIEGNQYYYNHNACKGIGKLPIKAKNTLRSPTPLSPTRPSSDDFSRPKNPRPRPRRRKVRKPGPEEPSF